MEKYYTLEIDYESIKCNSNYLSFYANPSEKKIYFPICFHFQNHLIIYLHLSIDVSINVNHIMKQFEFILFKNYSNSFNIQIDIPNLSTSYSRIEEQEEEHSIIPYRNQTTSLDFNTFRNPMSLVSTRIPF